MRRKLGAHALIEVWGCSWKKLDDILYLKRLFEKSIKISGLKKIYTRFHKFQPQGVTGFALLTTSHISIHTWPEYGYATIDIYACDEKEKVEKAVEVFLKELKPKRKKVTMLRRGYVVQVDDKKD